MMSIARDVIICGPPRSGTSLLTQVVAAAGHRQLDELIGASDSNPHGFCEDIRVNRLNDRLLEMLRPARDYHSLPRHLKWLEAFEPMSNGCAGSLPGDTFTTLLPQSPFVMKDPRLSFTLPAWLPHLNDPVVIVSVRSAASIATSLARMVRRDSSYFGGFSSSTSSIRDAVAPLWSATYRSVLSWSTPSTFLVDATRIDHDVLHGLGSRVGTEFTMDAVDPDLGHSSEMSHVVVDADLEALVRRRVRSDYERLVHGSFVRRQPVRSDGSSL